MKIYFEDGELNRSQSEEFKYDYLVDAKYGYTQNDSALYGYMHSNYDAVIYTNSLVALNNKYAWNEELGVPEIYLPKNGEFIRIDRLTGRLLREGHNILKMFMAGEFDAYVFDAEDKPKTYTYHEVRNNFISESEHKVYIDVWYTDDDNEEGINVATVDYLTKEVEYFVEEAKTDPMIQKAIENILDEIDDGYYKELTERK